MLGWTSESIKQWVRWMQWLDRWGYMTACLSFLLLGMLVFVYSWTEFFRHAGEEFLPASITLINDLLLVIILLELFRTVLGFLQSEQVRLEPFLHVGIIASIRRIITVGAELAHMAGIARETFYLYLLDVGLHVGVILALSFALHLIKKQEHVEPANAIAS